MQQEAAATNPLLPPGNKPTDKEHEETRLGVAGSGSDSPMRIVSSPKITRSQLAQVLGYLTDDAINGGYGLPAFVFNVAEGFPDYTEQFILPTSAATILLTAFCSYKRTQSAMRDKDGASSFIGFNIGIDFLTFNNFSLDLMAAIASAIMGPAAADAPWKDAGPIFAAAFLAGAIYAALATRKHNGNLNSWYGKLALEICQFMQVVSAGTSLTQMVTQINPITWPDFLKIFLPSLGVGTIFRALRSKYPVLYKLGDDVLPVIAYLTQSGFLLKDSPYVAPYFILLALAGFGIPSYALLKSYIGDEQVQAITDNPTLLPGKHLLFQSATPSRDEHHDGAPTHEHYQAL